MKNYHLKNLLKPIFLFLGMYCMQHTISANTLNDGITITGKVTDETNTPMPGVNIVIKGTTTGQVTNIDGQYSINVPKENVILTYSFVGYVSQEIKVGEKHTINIVLFEDAKMIDEVVIVGFGTTSIRKSTASVSSMNNKAIKEVPYTDMGSALQGRVAGVIVQQGSAEPGQNGASISIRGNGEPLYVIDGFVSTKQRFLSLNKSDIKSTTILKDAASTAVYGMNAGNGVVLVTTKNGDLGRLTVDFQSNLAINQVSYATERMNAYDYAYAINNLYQGLGHGANTFKSPEEMKEISENLDTYTNWEEACLRNNSFQNEHTLSLSGGFERLKFFGSVNYLGQDGNYVGNLLNYNRYNYRSNVNSHFDKIGLTIDFNASGAIRDERYPAAGASTIYSRIKDRTPFEKPYNKDGQISNQFDNPILLLKGPGYIKLRSVYNQLAAGVTWALPWVEGLSFGFSGNYNMETFDRTDWVETATYYDDEGNETLEDPSNIRLLRAAYMVDRYDFMFRADYKRSFAEKHNVLVTLVYNRQYFHNTTLDAGSNTFYTTAIKQIQNGNASSITASNREGEQASMGYVGRVQYDYNNRYMIEFAGRYDGSDNFPKDSRFGFFPSASAGWALSEEGFFQPVKDKGVLNFLKIRGSYGEIGINGADHAAYAYLPTYNYNANAYVVDGKLVNTVTPGPTPSINMTWYTRTKYDVGFDFVVLNEHLEGAFDWFFEKTKGYLHANKYKYTAPIGYDLPLEVSDAENRSEGFDGYLKYKTSFGEVDFSAGFNFTYVKFVAAKTNEDSLTLTNPRIRQHGNTTNYLGTGYVGSQFYTSPEDVLNNPKRITSRDLRPGDLWYQDVNGDGKIDAQDQSRFGHNATPTFVFGVDLSAAYKGLALMVNIQGTGRRQRYFDRNAQAAEGERRLDFAYQNDFWTPDNHNAVFPRPGNNTLNDGNNYETSDFWARNNHYIRLKSLTISYDLKYTVLKKLLWLQSLTVYASGMNLFAIGPSVKYSDPESYTFNGYEYPMMRTYSFGFQLGF